jgi:tRNA(fMet)-specific endonuclease VapC
MGLVLDSSVLVFAERQDLPVSVLLDRLQRQHSVTEIVLSAISVVELEHGVYRARSPQQAAKRRGYLDTVFAAIPSEPFTREIGHVVAQADAEARKQGKVIPFADLLIGGTALYFGYGLVTCNERHFRMIPNLPVHSFWPLLPFLDFHRGPAGNAVRFSRHFHAARGGVLCECSARCRCLTERISRGCCPVFSTTTSGWGLLFSIAKAFLKFLSTFLPKLPPGIILVQRRNSTVGCRPIQQLLTEAAIPCGAIWPGAASQSTFPISSM